MNHRTLCCLLIAAAFQGPLTAADSPSELAAQIRSALDAHDKGAFERCFDFEGTDSVSREAFSKIEEMIFSWPSHEVFTSKRGEKGASQTTSDGKNYTLNGDWTFSVHVNVSKAVERGFVFPAGPTDENYRCLMAVRQKAGT